MVARHIRVEVEPDALDAGCGAIGRKEVQDYSPAELGQKRWVLLLV